MRLFIAVNLKDELKAYISILQGTIQKENAKLTIVNPKNLHLTMKFLGEVEDNNVDKIKTALKKIKAKKINTALSMVGAFPNFNNARVLWVGLANQKPILNLQSMIDEKMETFDFKKEKNFAAHLTLARIKFVKDKKRFAENMKRIRPKPFDFTMESFDLIKSTLTPNGPIYEVLESFNLQ